VEILGLACRWNNWRPGSVADAGAANIRGKQMKKRAFLSISSLLVIFLIGCGGGNDGDENAETSFLQEMIPHHQGAVTMADIALVRSQRQEIRDLAENIKRDQNREIEQIHRMLGQRGVTPPVDHGGHGAGGMASDIEQLRTAEPFDRAFIDAMIPHHESAIKSAKEVKDRAKDREVIDLADAIIAAQEHEIEQMREWRRQWYGS
jgi:uncharacterized protein (DUF305 family)